MKSKVIENISWIVACRIIQSIIVLIIGMVTARYLGPSNYGLINYANSIVTFVVPIAQLGFKNILVEEIVSHPEHEGKILGTTIGLSVIMSILCIAGCISFVCVVNANEFDTIIICALSSFSLVFQMTEMIQYWYQAKLISKYVSVVSLLSYTVVAIYKIFLLITQKSIYFFAITNGLDYFIISLMLFVIYRKKNCQQFEFSLSLGKELFKKSKYYILSSMMVIIFSQTDKIMIKNMINDTVNGYYSAAFSCAGVTGFVFVAIIDSLRPTIFESKKIDNDKFINKLEMTYSIVIYLGLFQSLILTIFAKYIVLLLYGNEYYNAIELLRIITWYTTFSYMGSVRNIWMLAEHKQKYLWIVNLSGAVINILINFFLIPVYGAAGAAIASVFTQFFTNFVLCFVIKPIRPTVKMVLTALNPKTLVAAVNKAIG